MEEKSKTKIELENGRNNKAEYVIVESKGEFWDAWVKFFTPTSCEGIIWAFLVIACGIVSTIIIIHVTPLTAFPPDTNEAIVEELWLVAIFASAWPGAIVGFLTGLLLFKVIFKKPETIQAYAYIANQPNIIQSSATYASPSYQYINIPQYY
jgi:hypothetical protein